MLGMSAILVVDRLRMFILHNPDLRTFDSEQRRVKVNGFVAELDNDQLPWSMETAFYALSGGGVVLVNGHIRVLQYWHFGVLAVRESRCLLPLQRAVPQDPSKASGLAKFITCAQALWFCSQCIARLCQDMAISLLELNTFAHCISAFVIYLFWWHKPYDVATYVHIKPLVRPPTSLNLYYRTRSRNMAEEMFSSYDWAKAGVFRALIMFLTFLVYGAIHSLAWEYRFPTEAEAVMWRCASVATASSGLIVFLTILRSLPSDKGATYTVLHYFTYILVFVAIVARSFLVVESFRALPNSPASIYDVPRWTAYIPHI